MLLVQHCCRALRRHPPLSLLFSYLQPRQFSATYNHTTAAFTQINKPLREQSGRPHPLPATVMMISSGIKKLRGLDAGSLAATQLRVLWRGFKNMKTTDLFAQQGGTEVSSINIYILLCTQVISYMYLCMLACTWASHFSPSSMWCSLGTCWTMTASKPECVQAYYFKLTVHWHCLTRFSTLRAACSHVYHKWHQDCWSLWYQQGVPDFQDTHKQQPAAWCWSTMVSCIPRGGWGSIPSSHLSAVHKKNPKDLVQQTVFHNCWGISTHSINVWKPCCSWFCFQASRHCCHVLLVLSRVAPFCCSLGLFLPEMEMDPCGTSLVVVIVVNSVNRQVENTGRS